MRENSHAHLAETKDGNASAKYISEIYKSYMYELMQNMWVLKAISRYIHL